VAQSHKIGGKGDRSEAEETTTVVTADVPMVTGSLLPLTAHELLRF